MEILVVDDLAETRFVIAQLIKQMGHEAIVAEDGVEAFSILEKSNISMVISDWMMPHMNGLELCRKIRATDFGRYVYIIMLTARSGKEELIEGMESGADDFVVKPFVPHEIKVRIRAGERILGLEKKLADQNADLKLTNKKLQKAYSSIQTDLESAAALQRELLPESKSLIRGYAFDWLFMPCHFAAGDIFNFYEIDESHIGFYELDVAGHGLASAMLSFTLSKLLSPSITGGDYFAYKDEVKKSFVEHPALILKQLNEQFLKREDAMQYFTICYGIINTETDTIVLSRAGHPLPAHVKKNGEIRLIQQKGIPVGMLEQAVYTDEELVLEKGDRLFIYSDGVLECLDLSGEQFGQERLMQFFSEHAGVSLERTLEKLKDTLRIWHHGQLFEDDVTVLGIERV